MPLMSAAATHAARWSEVGAFPRVGSIPRSAGGRRLSLTLTLLCLAAPARAAPPPDFALPRWDTGATVRLDDFAGSIVVLDFFAYWCAPCERSARELETGIQRHYAARRGNARGRPVQVISVNVERARPDLTAEFIRRTGASLVVNDPDGALLDRFGAEGIPYLVILDGSGRKDGQGEFRIAYQRAGFEGVARLRQIIDTPGPPGTAPAVQSAIDPATSAAPARQLGEADTEFLWASDILLTETTLHYRRERGTTRWDGWFAHASTDLDYEPYAPFDFLGEPADVNDDRFALRGAGRGPLSEDVAWLAAAGGYDGYRDYRSLWLDTYYEQQYQGVPGYAAAEPRGANAHVGIRWEYLRANGVFEARAGYQFDQVAPGYIVDTNSPTLAVLRGREFLHTPSLSLSTENVLGRRVRTLQEFRVARTSGRESRFSGQSSLNWAFAERWVARLNAGAAHEEPRFTAWFAGASVEWEIARQIYVSLHGKYYADSGEIENSLFVNDAAPGVRTAHGGLGLRVVRGAWAFKLAGGPFFSRYDPIALGSRPFTNLYRDRNWGLAQCALSRQF
ncbi:MAG TPA: TlpA disulfide reductase family protein [Methylomirabilota bacterium]|nr:TlpA disulfide reductase family protein [Methylomirabilota bacterium]